MEFLKKTILVFILTLPFIGMSQTKFYKKFVSHSSFDTGNGIALLPDSSYAVTGASGGFDWASGQAFLMVVDSLGNLQWTKAYGGSGDDIGVRVFFKENDGFYIAGYTNSTELGDYDFVIYKTDEQGDLQWEKTYGTENWEILYDAKMLADGGLILVGQTVGPTTDGRDMYMVRTDALGEIIWTKTISTPADDIAYAVDTISATEFVIGGDMGTTSGEVTGMVARYNIDGTLVWQKILEDIEPTKIRSIIYYGNYIFAAGSILDDEIEAIWIGKFTGTGDYYDHFAFTYTKNSIHTAIAARDNLGFYAGFISYAPELTDYSYGRDAVLNRYFSSMYFGGFSTLFSAEDDDIINQIIISYDGGVCLVGTASDVEFEHSMGTVVMISKLTIDDEYAYPAELNIDLLSVAEIEKNTLRLHPNPTDDIIYLPTDVQGLNYEIADLNGKIILQGIAEQTISLGNLDSGLYFILVKEEDRIWTGKILKK